MMRPFNPLPCLLFLPRSPVWLVAVNDAPTSQIIGRELNANPIAQEDADIVLAHPARDVGQYPMAIVELNTELRIGECLDDRALYLDLLLRSLHSALLPSLLKKPGFHLLGGVYQGDTQSSRLT